MIRIRAAGPADFQALLSLNADSVQGLSPLDLSQLEALHAASALHQVIEVDGEVAGFLLALREDALYDNVNHRWFADRYPRFLYVDRIVISAGCRRAGLGGRLYGAAIDHARAGAVPLISCEYDVDPPNTASAAFHKAMGFNEVGRQHIPHRGKTVSMQVLRIS